VTNHGGRRRIENLCRVNPGGRADRLSCGQDACTGPVPTVDQVVGILQRLTDPNIPAVNKGTIVTRGFTPDEAGTIDDHLRRMEAVHIVPLPFVVTDIEPAPNHFRGELVHDLLRRAALATTGSFHQHSSAKPIVLVQQGGRWLITHDTIITAMNAFWYNATRPIMHGKSMSC